MNAAEIKNAHNEIKRLEKYLAKSDLSRADRESAKDCLAQWRAKLTSKPTHANARSSTSSDRAPISATKPVEQPKLEQPKSKPESKPTRQLHGLELAQAANAKLQRK